MTDNHPPSPYQILGDDGIRQLVDQFYEVMEREPIAKEIRAMHAEDLANTRRMLVAYLVGWMGGPPIYQAIKGTVCLTDPHENFRIGPKQRDAWLYCMERALEETDASNELKDMLKAPLRAVANEVMNWDGESAPKQRDPGIIATD